MSEALAAVEIALEQTIERVVASISERQQRDARTKTILRAELTRLRCGESEAMVRARLAQQGIAL